MIEHWRTEQIGSLIHTGITVDPTKAPSKSFHYVDVSSVSNKTFAIESASELLGRDAPSRARREIRSGDIILATIRPTLQRVAVVPSHLDKQVCSTAFFVFRPKESIHGRFLYYFLLTKEFTDAMERLQAGASYPAVSDQQVKAQKISYPPLHEQKRIVAILDEAFEGMNAAIANTEKNVANARELFERYRRSVFNMQDDGWAQKRLGDVCGFVRGPFGGSLRKSIFVSAGYAVYEQQHAIYNQFDDIRYFIDEQKFIEMKRFELLSNDIIMSCSGTMGRVAIVPKAIKRGIINQALLKLTPANDMVTAFIACWMESDAFQEALAEYAGGAAIQNVASVKVLKEIKVPVPSVAEQNAVVERIGFAREKVELLDDLYQRKLTSLRELKQAILRKAFSGELTPLPIIAKEAAE